MRTIRIWLRTNEFPPESIKKQRAHWPAARRFGDDDRYCLLAGALSAGGVADLFMSVLAGGVGAGRSVAAPVVVPGSVLAAGRHVTHARRRRRVGRACVCAVWFGGEVPAWFTRGVVQAIEQRAQHHRDGDREHRDLGAAGGTLGELGIGLQLIVETVEAGLMADFFFAQAGAVGIVRIGLVCHEWVPPLAPQSKREDNGWRDRMFRANVAIPSCWNR